MKRGPVEDEALRETPSWLLTLKTWFYELLAWVAAFFTDIGIATA